MQVTDCILPQYNYEQLQVNATQQVVVSPERHAIIGKLDMVCPSQTKIVRIFTSSTFTGKFEQILTYLLHGFHIHVINLAF